MGLRVVDLIISPTESRERLCEDIYKTLEPSNPFGLLQEALELAEEVKPLERKVFDAKRAGQLHADDTPGQIAEAEARGILTLEEANRIREFDSKVMALLAVDDFDPKDLLAKAAEPARRKTAAKRKKTKKVAKKAKPKVTE